MHSFPLISDLPPFLDTKGWSWRQFEAPFFPSMNFWMGIDRQGNRWLTKLRGDFSAYREIVFAKLAQKMGWSCQSSIFILLDEVSAKVIGAKAGQVHAAHWFIEEHGYQRCGDGCNYVFLLNKSIEVVDDFKKIPILHILNWPKSELAAYLFGGFEPPGKLVTKNHEFVIIDSESMFANEPNSFESSRWWGDRDAPTPSGLELAVEVCSEFLSLKQSAVHLALALPAGISIKECWPISPILDKSLICARAFIQGVG